MLWDIPNSGSRWQSRKNCWPITSPFCTTIDIPNPPPPVPVCRDPADVPFLQLTVPGQADALVTGDQDLLALGEECDFSILTATQLQQALST